MRLSDTQRAVLDKLPGGGKILHRHRTQDTYVRGLHRAMHPLDYLEFERLIEGNYIQSIAQDSTHTYYGITEAGRRAVEEADSDNQT